MQPQEGQAAGAEDDNPLIMGAFDFSSSDDLSDEDDHSGGSLGIGSCLR